MSLGGESHLWGNGLGQEAGVPGQGRDVELVRLPGGMLLQELLHPSVLAAERLYRVLPEQGWFDPGVSPSNPSQFELGAFAVPKGTSYWLFDYTFQAYRMSGNDADDTIPVEDGRLSSVLGFDLLVNNARYGSLEFELDPHPIQAFRRAFAQPVPSRTGSTAPFNIAASNSFASTSSQGTSLLPARVAKYGPSNGPFTLVAQEGVTVQLSCVIFNPVPIPLGFIEGRHAGYLIPKNMSDAIVDRMRPR